MCDHAHDVQLLDVDRVILAHEAQCLPELLLQRTAGIAVALVNAAGGGRFLGIYLVGWLDNATGNSAAAFLMLAGTMAGAAVVLLAVPVPRERRA
jgi:hypothetical protein